MVEQGKLLIMALSVMAYASKQGQAMKNASGKERGKERCLWWHREDGGDCKMQRSWEVS